MANIGKRAAELHRGGPERGGKSWNDVAAELGIPRERARGAARRWLKKQDLQYWGQPEDDDGFSTKQFGNYMEVSYTPHGRPRIYTEEQLFAFLKVDFEVWACERFEATSWEVGAKDERAKLSYIDGRATGEITKDGLKVEQLFRVFARFVKRQPEPIRPSIHPVQAAKTHLFPTTTKSDKPFTRVLAFGDPHFGFWRTGPLTLEPLHDRRALNIILQLAVEMQPDCIKVLGDLFDFAEMSKFLTSPDFRYLLQPAIYELHWFLEQLREYCPDSDISTHEGNHDERMRRNMKQHIAWACDLKQATKMEGPAALSVPGLLDLESLGIRWIGDWPNDEDWVEDVRFIHGNLARKNPGETAKAVVEEADNSTVFEHIHRRELATKTVWTGKGTREIFALSSGCACRVDGVIPARTKRMNWQQGCAVLDIYPDGVDPYIIAIKDGVARYQGVTYEGNPEVPASVLEWGG